MAAKTPEAIARWNEAKRVASRRAKRRRTGTCVDCGAVTRYNGHSVNGASERCLPCASARAQAAKRGTGPTQQRLIRFLTEHGEARFIEIEAGTGIQRHHMGSLLDRMLKYGIIERPRRGVYRLTEPHQ